MFTELNAYVLAKNIIKNGKKLEQLNISSIQLTAKATTIKIHKLKNR
jgi:hypothetical protein